MVYRHSGYLSYPDLLLPVTRYVKGSKKRHLLIIERLTLRNQLRNSLLSTIKSQMNPHFLFNTLNTIQGFIYLNDRKTAASYIGKFSTLLRQVLDNSSRQLTPLSREINLLKIYLDLENARYENKLTIRFDLV